MMHYAPRKYSTACRGEFLLLISVIRHVVFSLRHEIALNKAESRNMVPAAYMVPLLRYIP